MEKLGNTLPTLRSNLLQKRESSSVKLALADRLVLSEAIEAVSRMIRGYANSGQAGKSYIGAIAELLCQYPRSVAIACADPNKGVAIETRFMPTPADIVAWCERKTEPMREEAARENRIAEQLQARDDWQNEKPSDRLKALGKAWLDRSDPVAAALCVADDAAEQARREQVAASIETANRKVFERECAAAGIDPNRGASPELLKRVGAHQ